ncbi:MAG: glycine/sarcosine/betaine reductase complex component C subunit beta [Clostridiales bacterium]|nr:glycine/sarcosine/betaine reductase complex component C subunit beta [Clostridiales bacterium]
MSFAVLKGACYALIQANDILLHQGTTQTSEMRANAESAYLRELPRHLRSFEAAVSYPPNQVYIGNIAPLTLKEIARPWYDNPLANASRMGKYGEIMPLDEFYGILKAVDVFDLVLLEENYQAQVKDKLLAHKVVGGWKNLSKLDKNPFPAARIEELVNYHHAEPFYLAGKLVGCVKKAHDFDQALTAHIMFENLVSKASAALALELLFHKTEARSEEVEYIIECSEEACGDMNQRGGGNFAKAIGEICGCVNATGVDTRSFCAGPAHALVQAAALVQAGVYKHVAVVAGGAAAKLGMNGKDHVKKGLPVLEDMLGAFAVHIGENDGLSPVIRTDIVGRHTIGSGASPQAVMQAIVSDPLDRAGLKIADVDTFSVEMQNPEITEPAGAGDVPKANYKMIAALGVMRKEFEKSRLEEVVERIAMPGFAPTQGHIPSGVPFLAHCREQILDGKLKRVMIVGKGSLFLGRLTNLFDGVSFIVEANSSGGFAKRTRVGLTLWGGEHGPKEILRGAEQAQREDASIEVVVIGGAICTSLTLVEAADAKEAHDKMEAMLLSGELAAAVTMHYSFPIGVSTVGRVITPAYGKKVLIANTTGASDTDRVAAMLKNAISGIAVAKACGNPQPTVGILNLEGARQAERALFKLQEGGYDIRFSESARSGGGIMMRGNDLLQGVCDIMVVDSLTGNVLVKLLSAYSSGGSYEALGDAYGPGVGLGYDRIINIISRASGAPVVAGAICFAGACARGDLPGKVKTEFAAAEKAGLSAILAGLAGTGGKQEEMPQEIIAPAEKVVTEEIPGIEIFALEEAMRLLWQKGVYAASGMGCTGPVVLVAKEDHESALRYLKEGGYL